MLPHPDCTNEQMLDLRESVMITSPDELYSFVKKIGFIPFFKNDIPGFSVEEHTPDCFWFKKGVLGVWEWKDRYIESGQLIYGKFLNKKSALISKDWFPYFASYRRNGYDFDALYDDGMASYENKTLIDVIDAKAPLSSKILRSIFANLKPAKLDYMLTDLMMQTYVCIRSFDYWIAKDGHQYGWGIAIYDFPEKIIGYDFATSKYEEDPSVCHNILLNHLNELHPYADLGKLKKIIR